MVIGPDFSRPARQSDYDEISAVLAAAFRRDVEAELVANLRSDGDLWAEIVKPWEGAIAGYAAVSRMRKPKGWAFLAPIAVAPRFQRAAAAPDRSLRPCYAVGTRLLHAITTGVELAPRLLKQGDDVPITVVTCGAPRFFQRGGFCLERAVNLRCEKAFANLMIARNGHDAPTEELVLPPALSDYLSRACC